MGTITRERNGLMSSTVKISHMKVNSDRVQCRTGAIGFESIPKK